MSAETRIDDGGPAFAFGQVREATGQPDNGFFNPGMSLRDWFAGQALQGLMVNYDTHELTVHECVDLALDAADVVIAARKGGQP